MNHGTCIHFNGSQHDLCKRGVRYAQFDKPDGTRSKPCIQFMHKSARGGTYLEPGEIPVETRPFPNAAPKERCPFYEEPTNEAVQQDREKTEAALKRSLAGIYVASEWRVRPKPDSDRSEVVECPICKGRLRLSQSSYNGHVHGKCETAGCISWME